jgi:hypothetical protein
VLLRGGDGGLEALAAELDGPAVGRRRVDLRGRGVLRHEDRRPDARLARRPGDRLPVVPGARRGDARLALGGSEGRDRVVRAADLERARPLEILRLERDRAAGEARERLRGIQRCLARDAREPLARGLDVSERGRFQP